METFKYIKAAQFFPAFTRIRNYKHKLRGKAGDNSPLQFSKEEKEEIKKGISLMLIRIEKQDF